MTEDEDRDALDNTPLGEEAVAMLSGMLSEELSYVKLLDQAELLVHGRSLMTALLNEDTCLSVQCHQGHRLRRMLHSVGSWIILEYRVPLRPETPADTLLVTADFAEALECVQK